jgi:hypothetical protein
MLFKCQAFFNRTFRERQFLQQAGAKLGSSSERGQGVAQIRWGRYLHLLNNKPVGISGYVTRLTESLPKKLKGSLPSPEEVEAELSRKDGETIGG